MHGNTELKFVALLFFLQSVSPCPNEAFENSQPCEQVSMGDCGQDSHTGGKVKKP